MKSSTNSLNHKSLKVLVQQGEQSQVNVLKGGTSTERVDFVKESAFLSGLKQALQYLVKVFVGGNELRIWQTYDNFGNNRWHAFDPVTGHRTSLGSEAEMRVWIDRHYYRSC
jgi:hypothetical protein